MENAFFKEEVKKYLECHKINIFLSDCLNGLIVELPENPYKYMTDYMEKDLDKKMMVKSIGIKKYINKEFKEALKTVFEIETNTLNRKIELNLKGPFLEVDMRDVFKGLKDKNKNFDQNRINEVERRFKDYFENQNIFEYTNFEAILERFHQNDQNASFKEIIKNFQYLHFEMHRVLRTITFKDYLKENKFFCSTETENYNEKLFIKIFQSGKNFSKAAINFESIYIVLNKYKKITTKKKNEPDGIQHVKNNFYQDFSKARNQLIEVIAKSNKPELVLSNGTFLCPSDNIRDILKLVSDFIAKFAEKDDISICIDFDNSSLYNKESEKYDYGGKLNTEEELENLILKLIQENKKIDFLIDPFDVTRNYSYHRFYKKMDKNKIFIGSRNYSNFDEINFNRLNKEFFPKLKDDQFEDYCKDLFKFSFFVIDFEEDFLFNAIFQKVNAIKKKGFDLYFKNTGNNPCEFTDELSNAIKANMMGDLHNKSIRRILQD